MLADGAGDLELNALFQRGRRLQAAQATQAEAQGAQGTGEEPPAWRLRSEGLLQAQDGRRFLAAAGGQAPAFFSGSLVSSFAAEVSPIGGELALTGTRIGSLPLSLEAAWQAAPLVIDARLRGGRLDLSRGRSPAAEAGDEVAAEGSGGARGLAALAESLPRRPLKSLLPEGARARLDASLEAVLTEAQVLEAPSFVLVARDGGYRLEGGSLTWQGIPVSAEGSLAPALGGRWQGELALAAEGADLAGFLGPEAESLAERLKARLHRVETEIQAEGRSPHELWRAAQGPWRAEGNVLYTPQKEEIAVALLSGLFRDRLPDFAPLQNLQSGLDFALSAFGGREAALRAEGALANGALTLAPLSIANDAARVEGEGVLLDLASAQTEVTGHVFSAEHEAPVAWFSVSGPLGGLDYDLEPREGLQAGGSSGEEAPEARAREINPEELLKEGLENLLKDILGGG